MHFLALVTIFEIMENTFGHGFVTNIVLIAEHFALPPSQAWFGAGDHVEGLVLPEKFKGTAVEELTTLLKKKVIWHQPGTMDRDDARDVIAVINRLVVAIDHELGISDAEIGRFR
ncbi:MAG: hypothetical protein WC295_05285 [Methanoregula sp.]